MFTGLIERVGTLVALRNSGEDASITIRHEPWDSPLDVGESVAVNGACLTVTRSTAREFCADVLGETIRRTNLGDKRPGDPVNLERALRAGDRLGGHFVAGHVDGLGIVDSVRPAGRDRVLRLRCEPALMRDVVLKGSVACDGVSLTLTAVMESAFEVNIIPHTWRQTTLHRLQAGDGVNIETDMMAKYVRRCAETQGGSGTVSLETLQRAGFL